MSFILDGIELAETAVKLLPMIADESTIDWINRCEEHGLFTHREAQALRQISTKLLMLDEDQWEDLNEEARRDAGTYDPQGGP